MKFEGPQDLAPSPNCLRKAGVMTVAPLGVETVVLAWANVVVRDPVALPFFPLGAVIDTEAPVALEPETDTLKV
jgi:hypothetical protein